MTRSLLFVVAAALAVSGCSTIDGALNRENLVSSGVDPAIETQEKFQKVDLLALLDPESLGRKQVQAAGGVNNVKADKVIDTSAPVSYPGLDLVENAFLGFYLYDGGNTTRLKQRRDRVQDRLISASVVACRNYFRRLHNFQGDTRFASKGLSLILDAAGAVSTGGASQILSGVSGAVLGLGEAAENAYLGGVTLSIIENGIIERRGKVLERIGAARTKPIDEYTVERAVADALQYHEACTVLAGLKQAEETVGEAAKKATANADQAKRDPAKAEQRLTDEVEAMNQPSS